MEAKNFILQIDEAQLDRVIRNAVRAELQIASAGYYNKKSSAKYLGIAVTTLWEYERKGLIHSVTVGNREMFTRQELDRFASGEK